MRKVSRWPVKQMACAGLALAALCVMPGFSALAQQAGPQVALDTGRIEGVTSENVSSFKGIPYAQPPVGALRWRAPQPLKPWAGVRPARAFAHDCMQKPFPSDAAPLGTPPAEDCLYLNVWRPASTSASAKLPVMVWIYGGGFVNGGTSPAVYSGERLARNGVVLVSMNYRVGRFGFFGFPALTAANADGMLGNYGFMDQIAALKWVQRNIAAFGGDPGNVTIFGESAGGFSVNTLLTSPMAKGLFVRAIIESGGGRTSLGGQRYLSTQLPQGPPSAEAAGVAFAQKHGIHTADAAALAALRRLSAEAVTSGLNMATMNDPAYSGPMIDGKVVVSDPQAVHLADASTNVPLLIGANSMDIGFVKGETKDELFAPFGAYRKQAEAAYDPTGQLDTKVLRAELGMDRLMLEPARFLATVYASRKQPVYVYRFSYVAESLRKQWPGAPHATEIPYVFDTVKERYEGDLAVADEATATQMLAYWVNFAKAGDPNGGQLPVWPAWSPARGQLMNFTNDGAKAMEDPWKLRLDATRDYVTTSAQPAR